MLDSRWGLQSPLLQPRPPDDSDSVIAIPSGPTESGSLNGFVGMPVDTNVDNAFAAVGHNAMPFGAQSQDVLTTVCPKTRRRRFASLGTPDGFLCTT
jgi:hypothetical protein